MRIVGDKLENWANKAKSTDEKNLFGRSAFNRYYYSAYLITREMLGEFDEGWKYMSHKSIPGLLTGKVRDKAKRQIKNAFNSKLISYGECSRMQTSINEATSNLANLLKLAYDIRCVADYQPEKVIVINKKSLSLENYKLSSAPSWTNQVNRDCGVIKKLWKDLGIV